MTKLFNFIFAAQMVVGAVFFAALFSSSIPLPGKILAGSALVLITTGIFWLCLERIAAFRFHLQLLEMLVSQIQALRKDEKDSFESNVREWLQASLDDDRSLAIGKRLIYLLLSMLGFWLLGGWVLTRYV